MNRRQFLTGVSAAAVASALPAAPAMQAWGETITTDPDSFAAIRQLYFQGRWFWITGLDNVIHYSEPCDPEMFAPRFLPLDSPPHL